MTSRHEPEASIDYDGPMRANLARVFGERDPARRMVAIRELYAPDATLYEAEAVVTGHAAVSEAVEAVLASAPPSFVLAALGPAVGHHDVGRLRWRFGPPDGAAVVTGTDVVRMKGDRIQTLHVFIDPPGG